jgi:predicted sulfurtransferase
MRDNPLTYKAMTEEQYLEWVLKYEFGHVMESATAIIVDMAEAFENAIGLMKESLSSLSESFSDFMDQMDPHRLVRKEALDAGEHPALIEGWL